MFRHHVVALNKKLFSRVTPLRRLISSGWGAGAKSDRLYPTSTDHLPILSGIHPAERRRLGATLSSVFKSLNPDHILYDGSSDARQKRIKSRPPFVPASRNLSKNFVGLGIYASQWIRGYILIYDGRRSISKIQPGSVFSYAGPVFGIL